MGYQSDRDDVAAIQGAAIHEAGHVVAALAMGFEVRYSILRVRAGSVSGYTAHDVPTGMKNADTEAIMSFLNSPDVVRRRVIQALAGPAAETMLFDDGEEDLGGMADYKNAASYVMQAGETDIEKIDAFMNECNRECARLLNAHRLAVNEITNMLIRSMNQKVYGKFLSLTPRGANPSGAEIIE